MDESTLLKAIREAAAPSGRPEDGPPMLSLAEVRVLAERFKVAPRRIEIAALAEEIVPERYGRNLNSIGIPGQKRLLESKVLLVGLGGLGGYLLEMLVRMGVGRIRVMDGDTFEVSNLNRQTLCQESRLGFFKADAALERAAAINSSVEIEGRAEFATAVTLASALEDCNLLLDALGALSAREMLAQASAKAEKPLITAAVAGWTGWVSTLFPGEQGPTEFMRAAGKGHDAQETLGVPAPPVAAVAAAQAAEAVRLLTGGTPVLRGKMLIMDLAAMRCEIMSL